MAFCDCQCGPSRDRVWPDVSFALYLASVEVALRQLFAPSTGRWRSLALGNEHHVHPLGCVPFLRARTPLPGWKEICLLVRLHAPFLLLLLLLLAYKFVSPPTTHLDVTKNMQVAVLIA
jgi:hypothetical protein